MSIGIRTTGSRNEKSPAYAGDSIGFRCQCSGLNLDVLRLRALVALHDLELHGVALFEGLEAGAQDCAVVDENVLVAIITSNETITLLCIEPLYFACKHR
jgi:hypothetical protein